MLSWQDPHKSFVSFLWIQLKTIPLIPRKLIDLWLCRAATLLNRWPLSHPHGHKLRHLGVNIFFPSSQEMFPRDPDHNSHFWTSVGDLTSGNTRIQLTLAECLITDCLGAEDTKRNATLSPLWRKTQTYNHSVHTFTLPPHSVPSHQPLILSIRWSFNLV